jgi:rubredoxin
MRGKSYRIPIYPLRPGDFTAPDSWFEVFTRQPVRSLIVSPARCTTTNDPHVTLRGKTWSGAGDVVKVEVSWTVGATWVQATLTPAVNTFAWQEWTVQITLPSRGVWDVYARATDHTGASQPMLVPSWNPGGYGNNQAMKVDVEYTPPAPPSNHTLDCTVCGHAYDPRRDCGGKADPTKDCGKGVPFEELPADWRCPLCGAGKGHYHSC